MSIRQMEPSGCIDSEPTVKTISTSTVILDGCSMWQRDRWWHGGCSDRKDKLLWLSYTIDNEHTSRAISFKV
jgi:hypothetical protein